jgi:hypothetical protein
MSKMFWRELDDDKVEKPTEAQDFKYSRNGLLHSH